MKRLDFDEDQNVSIPGDDVNLSLAGTIAGGNHAKPYRAEIAGAIDFRTAAKGSNTAPPFQEEHDSRGCGRDALGEDANSTFGLLFIDQQRW